MKPITLRTNIATILMVLVTIISVTIAASSIFNQNKLTEVIKLQDIKISELIKYKKDFQFGQLINNDNSITSIEELKKMVKEIKDNPNTNYSEILGVDTSSVATITPVESILSDTTPILEPTP